VLKETLKYIFFMSPHTFPLIAYGIIKSIVEKLPVSVYNEMMDLRTRLRKQFEVEIYISHFLSFSSVYDILICLIYKNNVQWHLIRSCWVIMAY